MLNILILLRRIADTEAVMLEMNPTAQAMCLSVTMESYVRVISVYTTVIT